jgi:DUF971 family protein
MAKAPPPEDAPQWVDDHVLVTPAAQERLCASEIWYHFGGWYDEGDTYDTQALYDFERELDTVLDADLLGPDERLRCSILDALLRIGPAWQFVKIFRQLARCAVRFHDGSVKNIHARKTPPLIPPADCQSNRDTRRVRARARTRSRLISMAPSQGEACHLRHKNGGVEHVRITEWCRLESAPSTETDLVGSA